MMIDDAYSRFLTLTAAEIIAWANTVFPPGRWELAELPEIVHWPEVVNHLAADPNTPAREKLARNTRLTSLPEVVDRLAKDREGSVRLCLAENELIHKMPAIAERLAGDDHAFVLRALAGNDSLYHLPDLAERLADHPNPNVRYALAMNDNLYHLPGLVERLADHPNPDVRRALAENRNLYKVPRAVECLLAQGESRIIQMLAFHDSDMMPSVLASFPVELRRKAAFHLFPSDPKGVIRLLAQAGLPLSTSEARQNPALAGEIGILTEADWDELISDPGFDPVAALKNPHLPVALRPFVELAAL